MAIYQDKDKNDKVIKTKDGRSWYFRVYYTDITGERKQKESGKYFKRKDAKDAEDEFLKNIKSGINNNVENISFKDVFDEWLDFKKIQVKQTTFYGIKTNVTKHVSDYFKEYKLHSITTKTVNNWLNYMINLKYSIDYKNSIIGYFREVLVYANKNYNFDNKIMTNLLNLRDDSVNDKLSDAEWNFWTYKEFNKFIKNVNDPYFYTVFNLFYYTGMRKGEIMALTWNDINFKTKKLFISKSLSEKVGNGGFIITTPKTKNSSRIIDLPDILIDVLKKHYNEEKKIYNFDKSMFILGNISHLSSTTLLRNLNNYIEKANVKKITPHGFRHSHVSLLIDLGCDSRDVAERIGDTVEVVEKTYYHMFPDKKSETVKKLNNLKNINMK